MSQTRRPRSKSENAKCSISERGSTATICNLNMLAAKKEAASCTECSKACKGCSKKPVKQSTASSTSTTSTSTSASTSSSSSQPSFIGGFIKGLFGSTTTATTATATATTTTATATTAPKQASATSMYKVPNNRAFLSTSALLRSPTPEPAKEFHATTSPVDVELPMSATLVKSRSKSM